MFSLLIFVESNRKIPNPTIITPPIWLNPWINSEDEDVRVLLIITPKVEKTTEKPRTKNIVFRIILVLLTVMVWEPTFWLRSLRVEPEIYAKNAGIMGKIHGATNEPNPANAATARVISDTIYFYNFCIKEFFQIITHSLTFYLGGVDPH